MGVFIKKCINAILVSLVASFCVSCTYPHAGLRRELSPDGRKKLKIVYATPKMYSCDVALKDGRWAVMFALNDYTQISFPPPGAIIENRYFYYPGAVDQELNPLWEKPVLLAEHATKGGAAEKPGAAAGCRTVSGALHPAQGVPL
jgi:hypothetical protein